MGKPRHLDYTEAAAVPLAAMTAWQGLFDHGGLRAGQRVLIHGGAGGVGHFAIQFAKAKGATVATTVAASDIEFVRELGADQPIDYKAQRFEDAVHDVDLVDLVDGSTGSLLGRAQARRRHRLHAVPTIGGQSAATTAPAASTTWHSPMEPNCGRSPRSSTPAR